jgi:glycerol-3-phosphate cytidylyltransferase
MTKIGYLPGVFDKLHHGHLNIIYEAQNQCDELIIGVHTDDFVESYKRKPLQTQKERSENLNKKGFKTVFVGGSHKDVIIQNKINILFHGSDWELKSYIKQIRYFEDGLDKLNIDIKILDYTKGVSTTDIINNKIHNLSNINHVIFDLDNTLILNGKCMKFSKDLINLLKYKSIKTTLMTNNNKYSKYEISAYLKNLGLELDNIYTPLDDIIEKFNSYKNLYIWGTVSSKNYLANYLDISDLDNAKHIIVLYRNDYNYKDIVDLCTKIVKVPYSIGNIDANYPDKDFILPDTGALAKLIEYTTQKMPTFILGKPYFDLKVDKNNTILIGDSIDTDGKQAERLDIKFMHVNKNDPRSNIDHLGVIIDYFTN